MNQESLQPLLHWIALHPIASGLLVFLISLSESLAVVGLVVPGVLLMNGIGAMIGAGVLPAGLTLMWAILGAIAGDGLSYWLGHHYKEHLMEFWPFRKFPHWLSRGKEFFARHGGKSIVFGRFVGPVRPMIPVIAGMMNMAPRQFLIFNILSAIVWAPLYSLPGILAGLSLGTLTPAAATRVGLVFCIFLLVLWLIYTFAFKLGSIIYRWNLAVLSHCWHYWRRSGYLPRLSALMSQKNNDHGQLGAFLIAILSLTAFMFISFSVHTRGVVTHWDNAIYQFLSALFQHPVAHFALLISALLDPWILLPINGLISSWLAFRQYTLASSCWLLASLGSFTSAFMTKNLLQILRPDATLHPLHGYSYPSGHLVMATLTFGLAATLLAHHLPKRQRLVPWLLAVPSIILVAWARLYLGLHWFSDILGGLSLSLFWIASAFIIYRHFEQQDLPSRTLIGPLFTLLLMAFPLAGHHLYGLEQEHIGPRWSNQTITVQEWWTARDPFTLLCRRGAVKQKACVLNLQWLGNLDHIQNNLIAAGWHILPAFQWQQTLHYFDPVTKPELAPIPEFHRDRLPVLLAMRQLTPESRLLIELWQSDMQTDQEVPLFVGLLKQENLRHPVPLINLYYESRLQPTDLLAHFRSQLAELPLAQRPLIRYKVLQSLQAQPVLLIDQTTSH